MAVLGAAPEMALVGAVDPAYAGQPVSKVLGVCSDLVVASNLAATLSSTRADAVVVFTVPAVAMECIRVAMRSGAVPVVGTTGLSDLDIKEIKRMAGEYGVGAIIAPNFALGAVLMMKMACEAVKYFPSVEIIELHHDRKLDAPSGTAVLTARLLAGAREEKPADTPDAAAHARGGNLDGIRVHSVRLPGLVAHQEVIFGGIGQTLTIRHDSLDRKSFMPGVLLAVRKSPGLKEVIWGLENII
jgi:4-hydroxy-tetrahydrodipicolinate reductase